MRGERALLACAVALSATLIVLICYRPSGQEDLWWTLEVGDYIRAEGDVPRMALWTIDAVRDRPYVCANWLTALVFSGVAAAFGLDAIPLVPTLVALAIFASQILLARQLGAPWLLSVAVADAALWNVTRRMICRSEVFGYLYFALALNLIVAYTRSQRIRYLAALIVVALLWVNSHGSFPLLLALLPLAAAGSFLDAWRRAGLRRDAFFASLLSRRSAALGVTWVLVAAIMLVNPYGSDLVRAVFEPTGPDTLTRYIQEWRPLYQARPLPWFFVVSAALLLAVLLAGIRRISFTSWLLASLVTALWLSAQRHTTLFGIGAAFALADFASGFAPGRRVRAAIAVSLVAALVAAHVWFAHPLGIQDRRLTQHPSRHMSVEGLNFVRNNLRGNVLNTYELGGLLIYFAYPQVRVAIDSRAGPYPFEYFQHYRKAIYGRRGLRTRSFVDQYEIDHIVLTRDMYREHFKTKRRVVPEFQMVYLDELTVVLSRGNRER